MHGPLLPPPAWGRGAPPRGRPDRPPPAAGPQVPPLHAPARRRPAAAGRLRPAPEARSLSCRRCLRTRGPAPLAALIASPPLLASPLCGLPYPRRVPHSSAAWQPLFGIRIAPNPPGACVPHSVNRHVELLPPPQPGRGAWPGPKARRAMCLCRAGRGGPARPVPRTAARVSPWPRRGGGAACIARPRARGAQGAPPPPPRPRARPSPICQA